MSAVVISGDTSGAITLAAPAVSGTNTITLPAVTGNILVSTSQLIGNGTTTNDSASAGQVGEYISASVSSGAPVSLTSATYANITSISLTAGDWDVTGIVGITTGATTTIAYMNYGMSTTSAAAGSLGQMNGITTNTNIANTVDFISSAPLTRFSLASTTTIYLVTRVSFAVSTASAYGVIRARRVR